MVTVIMTTYDDGNGARYKYADRSIWALTAQLGNGPHKLILADDGSPNVEFLNTLALPEHTGWERQIVTGPHDGIGASLNRALLEVKTWPVMYTTDDWLLTEPLDLTLPLLLLEYGYDIVRLGPIHPNLYCVTKFTQHWGWWLHVSTLSGYAFATRPFLANKMFFDKIGPWKEGVDSYAAEVDYSARVQEYAGDGLGIQIAAINLAGPWEHIGEYEVGDRPVVPTLSGERVDI
jgi:hypothetical protein